MENTLNESQVNNLKVAMGVLRVKSISKELMNKKLGEVVSLLQYPEEELRMAWINSTGILILNDQYKEFREYLRKELAYLEDWNAINELHLIKN